MAQEHTKYYDSIVIKVKMSHVLKQYRLLAIAWCILEQLLHKKSTGLRNLRVVDVCYQQIVTSISVLIRRGYVEHHMEGLSHIYTITPTGKQVYHEILEKFKAAEQVRKFNIRDFGKKPKIKEPK